MLELMRFKLVGSGGSIAVNPDKIALIGMDQTPAPEGKARVNVQMQTDLIFRVFEGSPDAALKFFEATTRVWEKQLRASRGAG